MSSSTNTSTSTNRKRKSSLITPWALIMMTILMIFSFQNIIDNYVGLGLSAAPAFIAATLIYLLPFIFIIAELASLKLAKDSDAGFMKWVEAGIGKKAAFMTSFMFWFANLFYFLGALPARVGYAAFAFTGQDYTNTDIYMVLVPILSIMLFALITWISTWDVSKMSKITTVGGTLMLGLTIVFFGVALVAWIGGDWGSIATEIDLNAVNNDGSLDGMDNGVNIEMPDGSIYYYYPQAPGMNQNDLNIWGDSGGMNYVWFSTFVWVLMAADGAQGLGVYVNKVEGGQKTFSKSVITGVMIIASLYVFGTLFASVFAPQELGNSLFTTFGLMFYYVMGNLFGMNQEIAFIVSNVIIGWIMLIASVGGLLMWTSAPIKTFFSEVPTGVFSSKVTKQNKHGVPTKAAWIQFMIVIPLLVIPLLGSDDISGFFNIIKTAGGSVGMIPPLLIFAAYFNIRWKKDDLERGFKMGNRSFGLAVSGFIIIVFIWIFFMAFFPYDSNNDMWWLMSVYNSLGLLIFVLPMYLWYTRYEHKQADIAISELYGLDTKLIIAKYSLSSMIMSIFNRKIRLERQVAIYELDTSYSKRLKRLNTGEISHDELKNLKSSYKLEKTNINKTFKTLYINIKEKIKAESKIEFERLQNLILKFSNVQKEQDKINAFEVEKLNQIGIELNQKDIPKKTSEISFNKLKTMEISFIENNYFVIVTDDDGYLIANKYHLERTEFIFKDKKIELNINKKSKTFYKYKFISYDEFNIHSDTIWIDENYIREIENGRK